MNYFTQLVSVLERNEQNVKMGLLGVVATCVFGYVANTIVNKELWIYSNEEVTSITVEGKTTHEKTSYTGLYKKQSNDYKGSHIVRNGCKYSPMIRFGSSTDIDKEHEQEMEVVKQKLKEQESDTTSAKLNEETNEETNEEKK